MCIHSLLGLSFSYKKIVGSKAHLILINYRLVFFFRKEDPVIPIKVRKFLYEKTINIFMTLLTIFNLGISGV